MRSTLFSLKQSIDKVSKIDRKIAQIDNKEPDNTFTDSMRSMVSSLSRYLDKISKTDHDISKIDNNFASNMRCIFAITSGWAMSQKLPVRNFKWIEKGDISKSNEDFIKNYDENSDKGYIFEVDVKYPEKSRMLHSDLAFLTERMKINKCTKLKIKKTI